MIKNGVSTSSRHSGTAYVLGFVFDAFLVNIRTCFLSAIPDCIPNIPSASDFNSVSHHFRARGYKTFFMLNSVEYEILNAHKYKNIKKFGFY